MDKKCPICGNILRRIDVKNVGLGLYRCVLCYKDFVQAADIVSSDEETTVYNTLFYELKPRPNRIN